MTGRAKLKTGLMGAGKALLVLVGWCALIAVYLATYTQLEHNAVPVMVSLMDFVPDGWSDGSFHAKGSMENTNAEDAGDRMVLGTTDVSCVRDTKTFTVATADVYNRFLNLDVTLYDVDTWDDRFITFHNDTSICAISTWTVDRSGRTVNLAVRRNSPIPDYALKPPLHPCGGEIDKNITMTGGIEAYQQRIRDYEGKNGLYFHALLLVLNVAYFSLVWRLLRRSRTRIVAD